MIQSMLQGACFNPMSYQPSMTMRLCRRVLAVAIIFLATPSLAGPFRDSRFMEQARDPEALGRPVIPVSNETKRQQVDIDLFALMTGKCSRLKIAGRDFACRSVAYFHSEQGRANFTVVLDDPADASHVISFSGENARREQDNTNIYELSVDRMLLNSKDRPKVDGLPVPSVELSAGICKQLGIITTGHVSSISCSATDNGGKKYELQFESDGSPITVRKIREEPLTAEKRRTKQAEQLECRQKADAAKILPRDRTAYLIGCLESYEPARATPQ
jgi:hypothetical protein